MFVLFEKYILMINTDKLIFIYTPTTPSEYANYFSYVPLNEPILALKTSHLPPAPGITRVSHHVSARGGTFSFLTSSAHRSAKPEEKDAQRNSNFN